MKFVRSLALSVTLLLSCRTQLAMKELFPLDLRTGRGADVVFRYDGEPPVTYATELGENLAGWYSLCQRDGKTFISSTPKYVLNSNVLYTDYDLDGVVDDADIAPKDARDSYSIVTMIENKDRPCRAGVEWLDISQYNLFPE
jgi:hypothetical protein